MPRLLPSVLLVIGLSTPAAHADDLGGGLPASHGRVVRLTLSHWLPGQPTTLAFADLPPASFGGLVLLAPRTTSIPLPGIGTLLVDPVGPGAVTFALGSPLSFTLPPGLDGARLYMQGLAFDLAVPELVRLTDATAVDVFCPVAIVPNRSSATVSVVDTCPWRSAGSAAGAFGYVTFTPDRTRAYQPQAGPPYGSTLAVFDLTTRPVTRTDVGLGSGVRYGCAIAPDGRRLYVAMADRIAVVDTDPTSANYHRLLFTIATAITGLTSSIVTGPLDVAITPTGDKLVVAYAERLQYPASSAVGVIDLATLQETLVPVTTGGSVGLGTSSYVQRSRIVCTPDGQFACTVEQGTHPSTSGFVQGWRTGSMLNVVDLRALSEVAAIPTNGWSQRDLAVDRLGHRLWVAQDGFSASSTIQAELLEVDVYRRSAARFTVSNRHVIDPLAFTSWSAGPAGIDVTPDGATVLVGIARDGSAAHPASLAVTVDAATGLPFGPSLPVADLCWSASVQQR